MKTNAVCTFVAVSAFGVSSAVAQSNAVVTNPTASQIIVQPAGSAFAIQGVAAIGEGTNGTAAIDAYGGSAFFGDNTADANHGISVNGWGNLGIGTGWARGEISIVTPNSIGETALHIVNTSGDGYTAIRLGDDGDGVAGLAIHQFNAAFPGDPTSIFTPSSELIAAIDPGGLTVAAIQPAAPMRFFAGGATSQFERLRLTAGGLLGLGTTTPHSLFEVNGAVTLTAGSGASITFPDTTVQSTAWNGTTLGGDYAEAVDVEADRADYGPGDLIAIDPNQPGHFKKTTTAYSRFVSGVYSTKPGLTGRRITYPRTAKEDEVPMAMIGVAPVKVCDENGAIKPGDLIVSSSVPGYGMRGTDAARLTGAIVGKAMDSLLVGTGKIEVLIVMQ